MTTVAQWYSGERISSLMNVAKFIGYLFREKNETTLLVQKNYFRCITELNMIGKIIKLSK